MMRKQILGAGVFVLGACATLYGCGSSDDSAVSSNAGASNAGASEGGEAGARVGGGGGTSEGGAAGASGAVGGAVAGEAGEGGAPALHPPPSIDLNVCDDVTATPQACIDCCYAGGFPASTIFNDKCVCGASADNPDVCGSSTAANCFSCCNNAGYASVNFTFGDPTQCLCTGKFDKTVCAKSSSASDPETACNSCCLNDGYLHAEYVGTGTPSCTCSS